MNAAIQPPFTLYTLRVRKGSMGSPPQPVVSILQEDLPDGRFVDQHSLTPEQARSLGRDLIAAADDAVAVTR